MKTWGLVVLACVVGCSSPGGSSSSSSSSSGAPCCDNGTGNLIGALGFSPAYVRFGTAFTPDGGLDPSWRSVLISNNGQCTGEGHFSTLQDVRITVYRPGGLDLQPGAFPVTWVDYVWPNDGGMGGPHGESCVVTAEQYSLADGGSTLRAHTGLVTFTDVSALRVAGTLDVTLDPADGGTTQTLSGSFDAPLCNAGPMAGRP